MLAYIPYMDPMGNLNHVKPCQIMLNHVKFPHFEVSVSVSCLFFCMHMGGKYSMPLDATRIKNGRIGRVATICHQQLGQEIAEPHWLLHPLPAQDYCIEAIPGNNRKLRKCFFFSPQVCLTTVWPLRKLTFPQKVWRHGFQPAGHGRPPGHGWLRRRRWRGRDGIPGWSGRGGDPVGLSGSWAERQRCHIHPSELGRINPWSKFYWWSSKVLPMTDPCMLTYAIYGNMDPINRAPFMLAYIPAPWILWVGWKWPRQLHPRSSDVFVDGSTGWDWWTISGHGRKNTF